MSRSVERALSILGLFSRSKQEWGITEISHELQLSKSTVHGLVKTLESRNYLQMAESGKYRLGIKVFELGMAYSAHVELTSAAQPMVRFLTEKYRYSVHIAIYAGRNAVFIVTNKADQEQLIFPRVGTGVPAYCTAVGKVLLAYQTDDQIEEYLQTQPLISVTRNTITDVNILHQELDKIRQQGFGVDQGEALLETGCVAAPIFDSSGQIIAAISVSGPVDKILDDSVFPDCRQGVIDAARGVSTVMGFAYK